MKNPDKILPRAIRMERAIFQLERARKNMETAYRPGELGEEENPLTAVDTALSSADAVLDLMRRAIGRETSSK